MLAPLQKRFISRSSPILLPDIRETADLAVFRVEKEPAAFSSFARKSSTSFTLGWKGLICRVWQSDHQVLSGREYCFKVNGANDDSGAW